MTFIQAGKRFLSTNDVYIRHKLECTCIRTHTHAHIHTQTHIHTYTHTHIHTYTHTNIQTYKHTNIQTYKHTNIQTYKHTNIQTYKHTYIHTYTPLYTCNDISSLNSKLTWRRQNHRHLDTTGLAGEMNLPLWMYPFFVNKTCSNIPKLRKEVEPNRVCCLVTCGTPAGLADLCGNMGKLFPELEPSVLATALRHNKRDFTTYSK